MSQKHILSRLPNIAFLYGANHTNSMRSQFLDYVESEYKNIFISGKSTKNIFSNERIIIAEQVENLWKKCLKEENAGYDNLLEFEMDVAELSTTIPIFLEGCGALVETGAFFCKPDLRKKLLIIVNTEHFNKDSFIQKAIIKAKSLNQRIIYYDNTDSKSCNQRILKEIFDFRINRIGHQIDTRKDNPTALYFFLLKVLCNWKTKEEILNELDKAHELKKYGEKIDNHLKILTALGLIIKEPNFKDEKFLSVIRSDSLVSYGGLLRNVDHERKIFNQTVSKLESDSILLKYMKRFTDEDYFSYSYYKTPPVGYKKPKEQLDTLQKTLRTRILNDRHIFPIHESAMGYVEKNNIRKNVEKHSKNGFILKMD